MSVPCPVCRAPAAIAAPTGTGHAAATCRRCKADLALVAAVEARRAALLAAAKVALARGDFRVALSALACAGGTRPGPDLDRLRAAALLLSRDFPAAWACYSAPHE